MESRSKQWRASESPQDYFRRHGRRVRCTACGTWQRTDPEQHQKGKRVRQMSCVREGCRGRLRTGKWWADLERALAKAQRAEEGPQRASAESLCVDVAPFLDDDETDGTKSTRQH